MTEYQSTLSSLLAGIPAEHVRDEAGAVITSICYDSRLAEPGSLFVALRGGYTDGHRFLTAARERGAVAALVEEWSSEAAAFDAAAVVDDTRACLPGIAARFYRHPAQHLGIVGVTGTDGKTTTTYLLDSILRTAGYRTGLIGTVAVRVGDEVIEHDTRQTTPESLDVQRLLAQMRDAAVDWVAMEATSHGLELHRLDACPVDIAVVTNITREHLDFHGSIDAYRRAKARLLERVVASPGRPYGRGVVLNRDDEGAASIADYATGIETVWFSLRDRGADFFADEISVTARGTGFTLHGPGVSARVHLHLIGAYNVENALAAAAAAHLAGVDLQAAIRGLEALDSVPGRLVRVDRGQPFSVFVDYAHTPESIEKTIRLVRALVSGKLISVFGSAGERDRTKRPIQGEVSARLADFSVFTSEDPRYEDPDRIIAEIAEGAEAVGAIEGETFLRIEDRREAIRAALRNATSGDAVLLLGKGHERCIIYGQERRPWDEGQVAAEELTALGYDGDRSTDQ
jgi:UDP-N-acetylmuramoyl-L-alanyl-D-glutamate--2,6-diaminopimelate ligase